MVAVKSLVRQSMVTRVITIDCIKEREKTKTDEKYRVRVEKADFVFVFVM